MPEAGRWLNIPPTGPGDFGSFEVPAPHGNVRRISGRKPLLPEEPRNRLLRPW